MGRKWGSFALDITAKWNVTEEDMQQASEDNSFPRYLNHVPLARPSDINARDARNRQLGRCIECERGLPNHLSDFCRFCERQLEAELAAMGFVAQGMPPVGPRREGGSGSSEPASTVAKPCAQGE